MLNVTAAGYGTRGALSVYPNGEPVPMTSTLDFDPNEYAMSNTVVIPVGTDGKVCVNVGTINSVAGGSQAIIDVIGYL